MKDIFHKLFIGVAGPSFGYVVSISTMETWLRITSLVVGIAVGIASLISICFSIRRKYRLLRTEDLQMKKTNYQEETTTT